MLLCTNLPSPQLFTTFQCHFLDLPPRFSSFLISLFLSQLWHRVSSRLAISPLSRISGLVVAYCSSFDDLFKAMSDDPLNNHFGEDCVWLKNSLPFDTKGSLISKMYLWNTIRTDTLPMHIGKIEYISISCIEYTDKIFTLVVENLSPSGLVTISFQTSYPSEPTFFQFQYNRLRTGQLCSQCHRQGG